MERDRNETGTGVNTALEHVTDDQKVAGSNPDSAAWKLWQFPLPHFASVFRKRTGGPLTPFYLVAMPKEVKYPTPAVIGNMS